MLILLFCDEAAYGTLNYPDHLSFGCLGNRMSIKELNLPVTAISRCLGDFSAGVLTHLHMEDMEMALIVINAMRAERAGGRVGCCGTAPLMRLRNSTNLIIKLRCRAREADHTSPGRKE